MGAKKCFVGPLTDDIGSINIDCYKYYIGSLKADADDSNIAPVVDLYSCIEEAVYYLQPYTERQFNNCGIECLEEFADGDTLTSERVITDSGYNSCISSREECGRFLTLNSNDATAPTYATYYEACYSPCWEKATETVVKNYFNCLGECEMPDYSYDATDSSTLLSYSLINLVIIMFLSVLY